MATVPINQLALIIVSGRQAEGLMQQLVENHFYFTKVNSSGGVFQEPTVTLLTGLNNARLQTLVRVIEECCQPFNEYIPVQLNVPPGYLPLNVVETQVGGALVYTMDVERFEQV